MALMNPADYQDYIKSLNIKLPNMPASTGAQPPSTPTGGSTPPAMGNTLTPGYMQQPKPDMPMAAPQAQSPVNMPQFTPSQTSARDWINNPSSGQGGIDAYTATQNQRYADAYKTGNQDLLGRLQNDSQRVGYSLNMPQAAPVQSQTASAPPPSTPAPYGQMSPDQIKAEAQARIAKQVADRTRIANQTKAGYQTSYDRMNQNIGEDRTLENVQNQRNLNPFSGHSDYAQGMIARDRGKQDLQNQQDLQTRLGGVDSQLSDFLNQTPDQQQQIINDLTKQERDYGLQVGTLTGNLQGYGRTLAGSAQDANYTGMYNGQQTMQAQNQAFNQQMASKDANWNAYKDAVGMTGNLGNGPQDNWGNLPSQTGQASYPAQQQDIQNTAQYAGYYNGMPTMQKMMQDNTIKNMKDDNLRAAATEARTAGNQALATKFDIWDRTGQAPDGIPGVAKGTVLPGKTPTGLKESDIADLIDKSPYIQKQYDQDGKVIGTAVDPAQKQALSQYIASLGLPPDQAKQWFIRYGLWSPSGN